MLKRYQLPIIALALIFLAVLTGQTVAQAPNPLPARDHDVAILIVDDFGDPYGTEGLLTTGVDCLLLHNIDPDGAAEAGLGQAGRSMGAAGRSMGAIGNENAAGDLHHGQVIFTQFADFSDPSAYDDLPLEDWMLSGYLDESNNFTRFTYPTSHTLSGQIATNPNQIEFTGYDLIPVHSPGDDADMLDEHLTDAISRAQTAGYTDIIVNMSFGFFDCDDRDTYISNPVTSVDNADDSDFHATITNLKNSNPDILFIASSGNFSKNSPFAPAVWDEVISVGAYYTADTIANLSGRDMFMARRDVPANYYPNIGSILMPGSWGDNTQNNATYTGDTTHRVHFEGTSFAAPYLSMYLAQYLAGGGGQCDGSTPLTDLMSIDWGQPLSTLPYLTNLETLVRSATESCPELYAPSYITASKSLTFTTYLGSPSVALSITEPVSSTVGNLFSIEGFAYDANAGTANGASVDSIQVYDGVTCGGTLLAEMGTGIFFDQGSSFDVTYDFGGYGTTLNLADGNYNLTVCAKSTLDDPGNLPDFETINITVNQAVVTQCTDPFPTTATTEMELVDAIECANNNEASGPTTDTIFISGSITLDFTDNTTDGANGLPSINSPIIIDGQGNTLDRNQNAQDFRYFHVGIIGTLTLKNITVNDGAEVNGGAVYNEGSVILANVTISDSSSEEDGGAIYNAGTLTLSGTTLLNNTASNDGGALYSEGLIIIKNSDIHSNFSTRLGGGIYSENGGVATVINSTLRGNESNSSGGAIYSNSGIADSLIVINSMIYGNRADTHSAIYIQEGSIENSTIAGNYATNNAAINSTVAVGFANGVQSLRNSIVWGNYPRQIWISSSTTSLQSNALEGGLANIIGSFNDLGNNLTLASSDMVFMAPELSSNAPTIDGDYHLHSESPVINLGDASLLSADTHDLDDDSNMGEDLPLDIDGDVRVQQSALDIGADETALVNVCESVSYPYTATNVTELRLAVRCANLNELPSPTTDTIFIDGNISLTTVDTIVDGNNGLANVTAALIIDGQGNTIERSSGATSTFRIWHVHNTGDLTLQNVSIGNGSAQNTDSGITDDDGGAIFNKGTLTLSGTTILNNTAAHNGGGIYNLGTLVILNSTLENNLSSSLGGAIYGGTGDIDIVNSIVRGNQTSGSGGGIYANMTSAYQLTVTNSIITGNRAQHHSAIVLLNGTIENSTIAGNHATANSTSVALQFGAGSSPHTLRNSVVWGNTPIQIGVNGSSTTNIQATAIENGLAGIFGANWNDLGGNLTLSGSDAIFVAPELATSAPTTNGDYHLHENSLVINKGDASLLPADTYDIDGDLNTSEDLPIDIDGDARVQQSTLDMGADETAFNNICDILSYPYTATSATELRLAIRCAGLNESPSPTTDTILISGTITLTDVGAVADGNNGLPDITTAVIIDGQGHTIERSTSATDTFRLLHVASTGHLTLTDVVLSGGSAQNTHSGNDDDDGGAIYNRGTLVILNSTLENNVSSSFAGAIYGEIGSISLVNSIIRGNQTTGNGGGIYANMTSAYQLTVTNSIFTGNTASSYAALYFGYGTIANSTFAGNRATGNPAGGGTSALGFGFGNQTLHNSVVWGNSPRQLYVATASTQIQSSALEGGIAGVFGSPTDVGGNITLTGSDTVFVAPELASNAPTIAGDYHLHEISLVINKGDDSLLPTDTYDIDGDLNTGEDFPIDIDGDARVQQSLLDMGADETAFNNICDSISYPYTATNEAELRLAVRCTGLNESPSPTTDTILLSGTISLIEVDTLVDGNNGLPDITSAVIIDGQGNTLERSSGATSTFRLFHVSAQGHLTLQNITLIKGSAQNTASGTTDDDGGAIFNRGTLIVLNSILENNVALSGSGNGGAIFADDGSITVVNSIIRGNEADNGGAIFANSPSSNDLLTITNSIISGNRADYNGAIYMRYGTIENSTIAGNHATQNASQTAIGMYSATPNLRNSVLWGNEPHQLLVSGSPVNIQSTALEGGLAGIIGSGWVDQGNNLTLATTATVFFAPEAATNAPTDAGDYHLHADSPVINMGDALLLPADIFDLDGDLDTVEDLPVDIDGDQRVQSDLDMGADEISSCTSAGHSFTATNALTLIFAMECSNQNDSPSPTTDTIVISSTITLTDIHNTIDGNNGLPGISGTVIIEGNGFTVQRSSSDSFRLFHVNQVGNLTIRDLSILNGLAKDTDNSTYFDDDGGAIFSRGSLTLENVSVQNNQAGVTGGGVYNVGNNGDLTITNSAIQGNLAGFGGGVYSVGTGANALILNTLITGNYGADMAGGMFNNGGTATIVNTTIAGNRTEFFSGGLRNTGTLSMSNSLVWGNEGMGDPQITNFKVLNLASSGVEDLTNVAYTDAGGNIDLSNSANLFVAPQSANNAPTTAGDYHLDPVIVNPVINQGDDTITNSFGLTLDIDGEARIQGTAVDMGADETDVAFTCSASPYNVATASELVTAIECANAAPNTDTIALSNTISLMAIDNVTDGNNGLPGIVTPIMIEGNGFAIERSSAISDTFRIIHVGSSGWLKLTNVILRNGHATGADTDDDGGAIFNRGTLLLTNTLIHGNRASGVGGGIFHLSGSIHAKNVTLANNHANYGGGIRLSSNGVLMENSLIWGNRASAGGAQIGNGSAANLQLAYTGVEGLAFASYTNLGGNKGLGGAWNIFVAPEPAVNAPTTLGNYHLANLSYAVNKGNNALVDPAATTDFEGTARILNTLVDMGADERAFNLPPQNSNLVFNPGFDYVTGDLAAWSLVGSIVADTSGVGVNLHFPTTVDGWLRQIRGAYQLEIGLKMVAWVTVNNPDPTTRTFEFFMRDIISGDSYLCSYTVPPASSGIYYMQFLTQSDWEAMRIDIRPSMVGTNGVIFDDVEVRYRPNAAFSTLKECISPTADEAPTPPPDTELVQNDEFANGHVTTMPLPDETSIVNIHPPEIGGTEGGSCVVLDWLNTDNWNGYLPTSEVQFVFDPFPQNLLVGNGLAHSVSSTSTVEASLNPTDGTGGKIFDANGDGVADTLYDALSYGGHVSAMPLQNPPSVYGGIEGGSASAMLIREAVIAMLNDRYDSKHPELWWAVEIDTTEALAQGENAMLELAQQYALSNTTCG